MYFVPSRRRHLSVIVSRVKTHANQHNNTLVQSRFFRFFFFCVSKRTFFFFCVFFYDVSRQSVIVTQNHTRILLLHSSPNVWNAEKDVKCDLLESVYNSTPVWKNTHWWHRFSTNFRRRDVATCRFVTFSEIVDTFSYPKRVLAALIIITNCTVYE